MIDVSSINVLVACEESQAVCKAFRERGVTAYSCDLLPCSGGHPEWHIQSDCVPLLDGFCSFQTMDGIKHFLFSRWDIIIGFPPCTYFSNATMVNLGRKDNPSVFNEQWRSRFYENRSKMFSLFRSIYFSNCDYVAVENPVGWLNTHFRKPDFITQPFYFGTPVRKTTCFWLKGFKPLVPTRVVVPTQKYVRSTLKNKDDLKGYSQKGVYGSILRSKTFPCIANAMAEQWLDFYLQDKTKK